MLVGALLALAALPAAADAEERFEWSAPRMGTLARVVLYAPSRSAAEAGARAALARIARLDARLSDYRAESELSELARRAGGPPRRVSQDLFFVLQSAQDLARRSDGAFDVTVGPLSLLWRAARRRGALPPAQDLEAALARVGHAWLLLDPDGRRCRLVRPGMRLDLGGIGKGYAADRALAELRSRGLERALVTLGGEVVAGAPPPDRPGWTVEVRTPSPESARAPLLIRDAAVSTSGDTEQWLEVDGVRYSHVFDPRTGQALAGRRSVTVVAREGIEADALATALSVLGAERGLPLVEASREAAALFYQEAEAGRKVVTSSRWAELPRAGIGTSR